VLAGPSATVASDSASVALYRAVSLGIKLERTTYAASEAAASGDAPGDAVTLTWNTLPNLSIAFTASYIAAWTIAIGRVDRPSVSRVARIASSIVSFQAMITSPRVTLRSAVAC